MFSIEKQKHFITVNTKRQIQMIKKLNNNNNVPYIL